MPADVGPARGPLKAQWRLYGSIEGCKRRLDEVWRLLMLYEG